MTVTSTTARVDYLGNGVATTFAYPFRIFSPSDLRVVTRDTSGVERVLVLGTDYTVNTSAGSITLTAVLADGYTLTIRRVLEIKQGTSFRSNGSFFPGSHEDALDRLTMMAQQQQGEIDRALKVPETLTGIEATLPAPVPGKALAWDGAGTGIVNRDVSGAVSPIDGVPVVADATARDALFPVPDVDQRVQNKALGYIERYENGVWRPDIRLVRGHRAQQTDVEIIAHRGYSSVAPENTLASFWAAAGNAHSIEWDCDISSDGFVMVIHDFTVDRTTNGTGDVQTFTRAALEALDAGNKFDVRFTGAKIPRIEDALAVGAQSFQRVYPEIKRTRPGQEQADIAAITNAVINAGMASRCVMQSFYGDTHFQYVRQLSNEITLGYLCSGSGHWNTNFPQAAADGNAVMLCDYNFLLGNPSLVTTARASGVDVGAWTVDTTDAARRLAAIGVTRLMTNVLSRAWRTA